MSCSHPEALTILIRSVVCSAYVAQWLSRQLAGHLEVCEQGVMHVSFGVVDCYERRLLPDLSRR
jgi:hypothetical protein